MLMHKPDNVIQGSLMSALGRWKQVSVHLFKRTHCNVLDLCDIVTHGSAVCFYRSGN
jgi:hypothetical protein